MLTLYVKSGCPYSVKVLIEASMMDIELEEKNIKDPSVAEDLLARGGKLQTPYLVDAERGREMYESDDIIAYLHETFTAGT
jgi:glutathione S-transferase